MTETKRTAADEERSSIFLPPVLRRRCLKIEVERCAPGELEATIVSRRWSPPRIVQSVIGALPGYRVARAFRRVFGKKIRSAVRFDGASGSTVPTLHIGSMAVPISSIVAIALQGWQEHFGLDKVWDVMLLGPNMDILVGHKSYEEAERFAAKLSEATGVPLRESSMGGGSQVEMKPHKILGGQVRTF